MPRLFPALSLLLAVAACSGSDRDASSALPGSGGDFFVFATDPPSGSQIYLNDSVFVTFTKDVDLGTANLNSVSFSVFDLNGNPLQEQPRGTFLVHPAPGGAEGNTRVLEFRPAFPNNDDYTNGGFRAGRRYLMQLAQGGARQGATLRDKTGKALRDPFTLVFETVDGTTPSQLFRDTRGGGPQVVAVEAVPNENGVVYLGKKGERPVEVRVRFDQPLNPASTNVPTRLDPNPGLIDPRQIDPLTKGRVFLEYDDPEYGTAAWIPALVEIEANSNEGSTLLLTPTGVLPNNADVRVIVESTLEDLSGESNRNNAEHVRTVFRFRTESAREPQFDAVVENFDDLGNLDLEPVFLEPLAEIGSGYVRAGFEFEGVETQFDYRPRFREVVLNTDFTQITPENGAPFNVSGGVFQFRNVTIPAGVTVYGTGSKPMVWLVTGDFVVEGELTVAGGNGARVDTLNSANFPTPGGIAACGGGNGGRGSPSAVDVDNKGEDGYGPFQTPGGGGLGGRHSCMSTGAGCTGRGGGGGGGSFATQGDPHYVLAWAGSAPSTNTVMLGKGGRNGTGSPPPATCPQADAGPLGFRDLRRDNDFWGTMIDIARGRRITGELLTPRGGSGGGGGGDTGPRCAPNPSFANDQKGGGGGAGGGILIVKALGRIVIKSTGLINANGGNGGGGEQAGTNSHAGGGGGSGGMIVLMSGTGIHITRHGRPYAEAVTSNNTNGAYTFAIQADGGVGLRGGFAGNPVDGKYPGKGGPTANTVWDFNPIGGFGGMGIVQLMAPPGDNRPVSEDGDGSRTRLDDNIFFYDDDQKLAEGLVPGTNPHRQGGPAITGPEKDKFLGWRGFLSETGEPGVDDEGNPFTLGPGTRNSAEGDIRPSPILLPAPFAAVSRLRSRWIDTGATVRLPDPTGTDLSPRKMEERIDPSDPTNPFTSLKAGPTYLFAGTFHGDDEPKGYVRYESTATGVERVVPEVLPSPLPVASIEANAEWRGTPAYLLRLNQASPLLGQIPGRYTGYRVQLRNALGSVIGSYRILSHTGSEIYMSRDAGPLPLEPVATMQVLADLIGFRNSDGEGFGATFVENGRNVPRINARIGFAFHVNPKSPRMQNGLDLDRIPQDPREFLYELDLQRPEVMRQIRELGKQNGETKGAVAVQCDILFNTSFTEQGTNVDSNRLPSPTAPRPELDYLVLPFQF